MIAFHEAMDAGCRMNVFAHQLHPCLLSRDRRVCMLVSITGGSVAAPAAGHQLHTFPGTHSYGYPCVLECSAGGSVVDDQHLVLVISFTPYLGLMPSLVLHK
jgi:hypothetical protein